MKKREQKSFKTIGGTKSGVWKRGRGGELKSTSMQNRSLNYGHIMTTGLARAALFRRQRINPRERRVGQLRQRRRRPEVDDSFRRKRTVQSTA